MKGISYSGLVLNKKGLERVVTIRDETGCPDEIMFLMGASESITMVVQPLLREGDRARPRPVGWRLLRDARGPK
jgi:hypothetical protein